MAQLKELCVLNQTRGRASHRRELGQSEEERSEVLEVAIARTQGGEGEGGQVMHKHVATRTAQLGHPQCEEHLWIRVRLQVGDWG